MFLEYWLRIQLKKVFMGKEKKTINILIVFFISHKSNVKTFLKWIVNEYPSFLGMALVSITHHNNNRIKN